MLITMSSSLAPSATATSASNRLVEVLCEPWGKPTTVPTATPDPSSSEPARATSAGRTQTDAT